MTPEQWQHIQDVFHAALAQPLDQREAFVFAQLEDPDLQQEVLDLLQAEQNSAAFLDSPPTQLEEGLQTGTVVGRYRITDKIGAGGMGSVYLAERADGVFEKAVALKVVNKGMNTASVVSRFEQERAILARLDHPNIASVLDGGVTDDGRPYLVMEYIEGQPITDYCDRHGLNVVARLQLFREVCSAVQFAHQALVVHRDLKPSNILVTPEGTPKLLDFGIAKLLEPDADPLLTQTGVMLATPAYAAPEQLSGGIITTMTDVYALGVLLYELLTGRRPFEAQRTPDEYRALILNSEPLRPSTAITQQPIGESDEADTAGEAVAAVRGTQLTKLRSVIRGDLDNICLMAIMREPQLRYSSAAALADDIANHLDGHPVRARRQSIGYRLRKYYSRHKAAVAASISAAVMLIAFGLYHTARVTTERDIALEEQAKTEEVVQFVTGLFLAADPAQARGADITARELLDAGLQQIETEMSSRPEVQATMQRVLGNVYYQLGLQEEASKLLNQALQTQLDLYGVKHQETASTYLSLGMQQQTMGEFDAARDSFNQALSTRRALYGDEHWDVVEAISAQAFFEETVGEYATAEQLHNQALQMARALAGQQEDVWVAQAMAKLASLLRLQDRLEEAEQLLRDALTMQDRLYGGAHPESDETKRQLAELLTNRRNFEEAELLFKELIDSRTTMLGPDHYETGSAWNSYGHLLSAKGDRTGAIDAYNRMLSITRKSYGDTHPALAAGYNNVAIMERNLGNYDKALEGFKLSLAMQDAVGIEADHPLRAYPLSGMARIYLLMRRFAEAAHATEQALQLRRAQMDEDHILIIELKSDIGAMYTELDRFDEAEGPLLEAYQHLRDNWGADDPRTGLTAGRLVRHYERRGLPENTEPYRAAATPQADDIMLQYY